MKYIHELRIWPRFRWSRERLADRLTAVRHRQGRLIGRMEGLGFHLRAEAVLQTLTEETIKSGEIEGEKLDREQVRSSLARRLGMDAGGLRPADRRVEGVVEMMLDATQKFDAPLTVARLFGWHAALFPTGRSGMSRIRVGKWRDDKEGPMQVVSGAVGKQRIHYQAPAAARLKHEMGAFLTWFNGGKSIPPPATPVGRGTAGREAASPPSAGVAGGGTIDAVLKAGLAHLWFVTIHPFDDGNGRIARAIADMALARSENSPQRFYSMSAQIRAERKAYYEILEATQRSNLDISDWLVWFLGCLDRAFTGAGTILADVLRKARFWEVHSGERFNDRQRAVLNRLLDGLEGKLTSSKWARLAKCSQDTASRDIDDLICRGILTKNPAGGRSTSYSLSDAGPQSRA